MPPTSLAAPLRPHPAVWPDTGFSAVAVTAVLVTWVGHASDLRSPSQHAALALMLAVGGGLLVWNLCACQSYRRWRVWSVPVARVLLLTLPEAASLTPLLLQATPTPGVLGGLADVGRMLMGSRSITLLLASIGLPLDLLQHLAVQTLCLFSIVAFSDCCKTPFLDNHLMEDRFTIFHELMRLSTLGLAPPVFGHEYRHQQCAAVLNFLRVFGGWLLPTYLAVRATHQTFLLERRQPTQQRPQLQQGAGSSAGNVQPSGSRSTHCVLAPLRRTNAQGLDLDQQHYGPSGSHRLAAWLRKNVFLEDAVLFEVRVQAWFALAGFCWLAAIAISAIMPT